MTNEEKNKIIELSQQGLGYTKIADRHLTQIFNFD